MSNYSIVKIGKLCWDKHKGRAPLSYLCDLSSAQSSTLNVVGAHWILGSEWAERNTAEAWFSVLQLWTAPTACHRAHACRSHEDFHRASAGKDFFPPSSTSCVQALGLSDEPAIPVHATGWANDLRIGPGAWLSLLYVPTHPLEHAGPSVRGRERKQTDAPWLMLLPQVSFAQKALHRGQGVSDYMLFGQQKSLELAFPFGNSALHVDSQQETLKEGRVAHKQCHDREHLSFIYYCISEAWHSAQAIM